jgi:D-sedoheptulose 7-phosphate isomerase
MYTEYLKELIHYLKETKVYGQDHTPCKDYEEAMGKLVALFSDIKKNGRQVFFIGNGGSAAIASHMTADFMKNGGMKTYSLYDNSVTTCMGNDYGYEYIFSRPLEFLGNEGDLLVAISSSGNSQNIVNAILVAQEKQMKIVTLSGFDRENRIVGMGTYNVHVPVRHYGMVESIHNLILQEIVDAILERDGECL